MVVSRALSFVPAGPQTPRQRARFARGAEENRSPATTECHCGAEFRTLCKSCRLLLELTVAAGSSDELQAVAAKKPVRDPSAPLATAP
jgi:hypothetical protein